MLKLIRAFLTAGVMENGLVGPVDEGTPQGGPLSPLLSNLVLDELDRELERRKHCFVRYADDCNIYVRSQRAGERVKRSITGFITRRLKLKVNEAKSAVARPVRTQVPRLQLYRRKRAEAAYRRQGSGALQAEGAGAYGPDSGYQYRADDEGTGQLFTRLEGLLRLLRRRPRCLGIWTNGYGEGCDP